MDMGLVKRELALTTALLMTMFMAVAQADTNRIADLMNKGAGYVMREGNKKTDKAGASDNDIEYMLTHD